MLRVSVEGSEKGLFRRADSSFNFEACSIIASEKQTLDTVEAGDFLLQKDLESSTEPTLSSSLPPSEPPPAEPVMAKDFKTSESWVLNDIIANRGEMAPNKTRLQISLFDLYLCGKRNVGAIWEILANA